MIHGHAVLEMVQDHTYTMEDLLKAIDEKFGSLPTPHTGGSIRKVPWPLLLKKCPQAMTS